MWKLAEQFGSNLGKLRKPRHVNAGSKETPESHKTKTAAESPAKKEKFNKKKFKAKMVTVTNKDRKSCQIVEDTQNTDETERKSVKTQNRGNNYKSNGGQNLMQK